MTAGEAESFYESLKNGTATALPKHVMHSATPRADLRHRQLDELADGAFEDAPDFRKALISLCEMNYNSQITFELALVELREQHGRPVLTTKEVQDLFVNNCGGVIEPDDNDPFEDFELTINRDADDDRTCFLDDGFSSLDPEPVPAPVVRTPVAKTEPQPGIVRRVLDRIRV